MNAQCFKLSSEYKNVGPTCAAVMEHSSKLLSDEKLIELQIALSEALNNVIEHSYRERAGQPLTVRCFISENNVVIAIEDKGDGIPGGWQTSSTETVDFDPADLAGLPEGGMGMRLIEECVDELNYEANATSNVLTFKKFK